MIINTPISIGELLDKISILKIKQKKIIDISKNQLVIDELRLLEKALKDSLDLSSQINNYINDLEQINLKLWEVEDDLRNCERKKVFDNHFISMARSVYLINDKRSNLKLEINKKFNSKIVEVKSYEKY